MSSFWSETSPDPTGGAVWPPVSSPDTGDTAATPADTAGPELEAAGEAAETGPESDHEPLTESNTGAEAGLEAGDSSSTPATPARTPPTPAPAGARRTFDWSDTKRRYVEGVKNPDGKGIEWPSIDACAAHFGLPANRAREAAAREGWVAQRARWQAQVETERQRIRATAMAKAAVQLDSSALKGSEMGIQLCLARLSELGAQAQRARQDAGPGGTARTGVDAQEQQRLAQAVDLWYKIGLRAVGDPETHRVEITGVNGAPIEIATELKRDDPDRLAGVLGVLAQAGLGELFGAGGHRPDDGGAAALEARR